MSDLLDIATMEAKDEATIELNDSSGEPLYSGDKRVSVTVYGPGSKQYGEAQKDIDTTAFNLALTSKKKKINYSQREMDIEVLVKCTKSFNNFTYLDYENGPDLFRAVYSNSKLNYLTEQVHKGMLDWANFT